MLAKMYHSVESFCLLFFIDVSDPLCFDFFFQPWRKTSGGRVGAPRVGSFVS
jgi:hypothetical protein